MGETKVSLARPMGSSYADECWAERAHSKDTGMTPRGRSLLFVAVAVLMQLAFAELRLEARADTVELRPGALAETSLAEVERTLSLLREAPAIERGASAKLAGGKPKLALAAPLPPLEIENTGAGVLAARKHTFVRRSAPRERCPTGPPAAA